jgi:DNA-binding NtrC family response regulator
MFANHKVNLLLIEDEEYDVRRVRNTLKPFQDRLIIKNVVSNGQAALGLINENPNLFDVIIMDFQIAGGLTGESLIKRIKEFNQALQIIVITKMTINLTDFDFANRLIEAGAVWYCTKYPGDIEEYIYQPTDFILSIFNAAEKKSLEAERYKTSKKLSDNVQEILNQKQIVGNSEVINNLRREIQKGAQSQTNVLIRGKSGTGKELVASHIHYLGARKFEKFVTINCGSLPQELVESELFGHVKGAFTGAIKDKVGRFELAHDGTIFLDEIGDISLNMQLKLLRVLQEGEFEKVGDAETKKVNVRIIAATNKDLEAAITEGKFREDLYYRLNVFSIWVLPLRDRKEDIPQLVHFFLEKFSKQMSRECPSIEEKGMNLLMDYDWPGNVRELQNIVQRLLLINETKIMNKDVSLTLGTLKMYRISKQSNEDENWRPNEILTLREMETKSRRKYFRFVRENSMSDAEAARKLGLAPPNYFRMCKELGIK